MTSKTSSVRHLVFLALVLAIVGGVCYYVYLGTDVDDDDEGDDAPSSFMSALSALPGGATIAAAASTPPDEAVPAPTPMEPTSGTKTPLNISSVLAASTTASNMTRASYLTGISESHRSRVGTTGLVETVQQLSGTAPSKTSDVTPMSMARPPYL